MLQLDHKNLNLIRISFFESYLPGLHIPLRGSVFEQILFKMETLFYFQKMFEKSRDKPLSGTCKLANSNLLRGVIQSNIITQ